jgi:hypothetical protein
LRVLLRVIHEPAKRKGSNQNQPEQIAQREVHPPDSIEPMSKVTEFAPLRERAKQRKEKALAKIREEYEEALSQIAALEQFQRASTA